MATNYPPPRPLNMPQTQVAPMQRRPMPTYQGPQGYRPPQSRVYAPPDPTPYLTAAGRESHNGPRSGPPVSPMGQASGTSHSFSDSKRTGAANAPNLGNGSGFTSMNPTQSNYVKAPTQPSPQQTSQLGAAPQARPGQLGGGTPAPGYEANVQSRMAAEYANQAPSQPGVARPNGPVDASQSNTTSSRLGTGAAPAPGAQANMQSYQAAQNEAFAPSTASPYSVPISQLGEPDPQRAMMAMRAAQGRRF